MGLVHEIAQMFKNYVLYMKIDGLHNYNDDRNKLIFMFNTVHNLRMTLLLLY